MNSKMNVNSLWIIALSLLVFGLSGCDDATQNAAPPPKAKKAATVDPDVEEVATASEYVRLEYPNGVRRNPFQPDPNVVAPQANLTNGEVREAEPLERFGLGSLELVAIISEIAVPKAMFIDPDGLGHVVKENDRIGRNGGVVADIRENEVEVLEASGEDEGQTLQRIVKLREVELAVREGGDLSEEEKQALERLLETEAGRKAIEEKYREQASGANATESQPPGKVDSRFKGFAPPK